MNTRKLASVVALLLLIAVVVPFVVYAAPWTIGADESYVVLTASMTPAIAPGDVVIVDDRGSATIAEGDVITFRRGDGQVPVTHRVVGVDERNGDRAFATKGDANEDADSGLVPASNVLGTVILTIPYLGYVIQFGNSPSGFLILVVVPFGLLAITEVWSFVGPQVRAGNSTKSASTGGEADTDMHESESATAASDDGDGSATAEAAESPAAESSPAASTEPTDERASGTEISLDAVTGAAAILALGAPYAVYVAFRMQSAVTLSVAFAATVTLLGALGILLSARWGSTTTADADAESDERTPSPNAATATASDAPTATTASDGGTPVPTDGEEFEPADPVDRTADDGRAER